MFHSKKALLLLLLTVTLLPSAWTADSFSGVVWDVLDGDSLVIRKMNRTTQTVHLYGVDSPELKQNFGKESMKFLHVSSMKRFVRVFVKKYNKDGSVDALVVLQKGVNLNEEMVKTGLAWQMEVGKKDKTIEKLQKQAREEKLGLWKAKSPIPPWKFRATAPSQTTAKTK